MRWLIKSPSIIYSGKLKIFTPTTLGKEVPTTNAENVRLLKCVWQNSSPGNFTCSSIFPGWHEKWHFQLTYLFPRHYWRWFSFSQGGYPKYRPRPAVAVTREVEGTTPALSGMTISFVWNICEKGDVFSKIWWILETNSVLTMRVGWFLVPCIITFLFGGVIWLLYTESPIGTYHISSRSKRISSKHS